MRVRLVDAICDATLSICLTLHSIAKAAEFVFLVERAYIISWPVNPRHKVPEYVLSCILILSPYTAVVAVSMRYRIAHAVDGKICIVGIELPAMLSLLAVEIAAQTYLTIRFLLPLVMVHRDGTGLLLPLRRMVIRTCIGSAITLLSNTGARTYLVLFNGVPAWLCCLTCKVDCMWIHFHMR